MQKQYWAFYWPLTLTGLAMLLAKQFENGVLARYPDAANELAIFAYAWSVFFLFNAPLIFVPQMVTRLAHNGRDRGVCLRFLLITCGVLTLPLAITAFSPAGPIVLTRFFEVSGRRLVAVTTYLRFLTPMVLVTGLRLYVVGLLVQEHRTRTVTTLNVAYLTATVSLLIVGFRSGWQPVITVAVAQVSAASLHLVLGFLLYRLGRSRNSAQNPSEETVTYGEVFSFFWPVALTSTMFAFSRPILYSFVSRIPDSATTVAALRVAFDLAMIFHNPVNQSRHLFVTFGLKDRAGLQVFVTRMIVGLTLGMILLAATPVLDVLMVHLLGVEESIRSKAHAAFWVLCFVPLAIGLRNMIHGTALVQKRTTGMGIGGVVRNVVIYVSSWACYRAGVLNHMSAAAILVAGFVVEGTVVQAWLRSVERVKGPMLRADFFGALGISNVGLRLAARRRGLAGAEDDGGPGSVR